MYGPAARHPSRMRGVTPGFDKTGPLPPPGASLPGTLASPRTGTSTGWLTSAPRSGSYLSHHLTSNMKAPELPGRTYPNTLAPSEDGSLLLNTPSSASMNSL